MAKKVSQADIQKFNELYYEYKNYAKVGRETGFSAGTVSKYVDKNWKPVDKTKVKHFTMDDLPPLDLGQFVDVENYGVLCQLSDTEKEEIKELWGELNG